MISRVWLVALALAFCVLATANSGGYRYGASDQAFYEPAIAERADPSLFPRDKPVLAAQSRLWFGDDLIGGIARLTGVDLPALFLALYLITLIAMVVAADAFVRALGASSWVTAAFVLLLTLKHRIAKTGANTLEGYMHPRILAFALGLAALACLLRRRRTAALVLIAVAAALHTTTALWFGIAAAAAMTVDLAVADGRARRIPWTIATAGTLAAALVTVWAFTAGPLAGRLVIMDPEWLRVLETKDYLFPADWPFYAWAANLAYPALIVLIYRARARRHVAVPAERAIVVGLLVLVAIFAVAVPLTAFRIALAVQMQVNRVFWVLDAVTTAYVAWWLMETWPQARVRAAVLGLLLAVSAGRGFFVLVVEARRPLVDLRPRGDWVDALRWIETQPARWHVLADPEHAWKQGLSVRVGAHRDTVLEASKDSAVAMYDRAIAMRVAERSAALEGFESLGAPEFRALARRYGIDVLAIERDTPLDLPVLHRQGRTTVYDLR